MKAKNVKRLKAYHITERHKKEKGHATKNAAPHTLVLALFPQSTAKGNSNFFVTFLPLHERFSCFL